LRYGGAFACLEEIRLEVTYYLNTYFNFDRRHSALGYRSPHQFERKPILAHCLFLSSTSLGSLVSSEKKSNIQMR
jgi:hypothetical protein